MSTGFVQKGTKPREAIWTFMAFDLHLQARQISRQLYDFLVREPNTVVWFAFDEVDVFLLQRRPEVLEGLFEDLAH
jgi:hypothetical protein